MEITHIYDNDTEIQILGECMHFGGLYEIRDLLEPSDFYFSAHGLIYRAICSISDRGGIPEAGELKRELQKMEGGSTVSDADISSISFAGCRNIRSAALTLKDYAQRNAVIDTCLGTISKAKDPFNDIDGVRSDVMSAIGGMEPTKADFLELKDILPEVHRTINDNMAQNGKNNRRTGFRYLDHNSGGLHRSSLIVIGGASSQGKTSFATAIAANACAEGAVIGMFSMEMTPTQIAARMVATRSGVDNKRILYMPLTQQEMANADNAIGTLGTIPGKMYFDGRANSNIDTIMSSIRMMVRRYGIEGAIVDYMQILNVNMPSANKEQQMGDVARKLKNLAMELDIWVICLSQLNRDRMNPEPSIDRLRDSGQIAEAADDVMLVYRPETENREYSGDFAKYDTHGTAEIKIVKGRNIGTGHFLCAFTAETTDFHDIKGDWPLKQTKPADIYEQEQRPF